MYRGLDVFFLIADDQGAFIGIEVGHHCIGHKQQIDHIHVGDIRHLIHKYRIERQENQTQRRNGQANGDISLFIKGHVALDPLHIPLCQGLIQAVGHGRPHAQFHQRKHGQHIGKQSVQSKIGVVQIVQKKHPCHKVYQNTAHLAHHGSYNITNGILGSCHEKPPKSYVSSSGEVSPYSRAFAAPAGGTSLP